MSETSGTLARLRLERDRFIAFAFAGADVLLELDTGHRVGYAAGATRALFGAPVLVSDRSPARQGGVIRPSALPHLERSRTW